MPQSRSKRIRGDSLKLDFGPCFCKPCDQFFHVGKLPVNPLPNKFNMKRAKLIKCQDGDVNIYHAHCPSCNEWIGSSVNPKEIK